MNTTVARRRFTVRDYERMVEAGILGEDDRVQLLDGDIVTMAPIGPRHAACVNRVAMLFSEASHGRFIVSVQNPISLPNTASQPEPDVTLLVPPLARYADRHPGAQDVLLVIEVADTSPDDDLAKKLLMYARGGVREVWVVHLPTQTIERHDSPSPTGYAQVTRPDRSQTLAPAALADLTVRVEQIFSS